MYVRGMDSPLFSIPDHLNKRLTLFILATVLVVILASCFIVNSPLLLSKFKNISWDISNSKEDNVKATLVFAKNHTYILLISGKGEMRDLIDINNPHLSEFYNISVGWTISIISVVIEEGVTNICDYAFLGCTALNSVIIPNSIKSIGNNAFSYCPNLTSIFYEGTVAQWSTILLDSGWNRESSIEFIECIDGIVTVN